MKDQEYDYIYEKKGDLKYCYPNSNVLINKLGITDLNLLHNAERDLVSIREADLYVTGLHGDFSLKYLCEIHRYLFQDIYEWAGKVRTVDIAKGTVFCFVQFIEQQFQEVHNKLKAENYLKNIKNKEELSVRLAYYLGEINMIHPFREGNGRTQRFYITMLCDRNAVYDLTFKDVSKDDMLRASVMSANGDNTGLQRLIYKSLIKKENGTEEV